MINMVGKSRYGLRKLGLSINSSNSVMVGPSRSALELCRASVGSNSIVFSSIVIPPPPVSFFFGVLVALVIILAAPPFSLAVLCVAFAILFSNFFFIFFAIVTRVFCIIFLILFAVSRLSLQNRISISDIMIARVIRISLPPLPVIFKAAFHAGASRHQPLSNMTVLAGLTRKIPS